MRSNVVHPGCRKVPYRRKRFNGDENPILELAHGIFGFAKGLGAFLLISNDEGTCLPPHLRARLALLPYHSPTCLRLT